MSNPLGVVIHFEQKNGLSQYLGWPFTSMAKIGRSYFGAGPDGLFKVGGENDAGEDINCIWDLPETDLDNPQQKRIRSVFLGGKFDGDAELTTFDDSENERTYDVAAPNAVNQRSVKIPVGRDGKGRYWRLRFKNVYGSGFAVDAIDVNFLVLPRRP